MGTGTLGIATAIWRTLFGIALLGTLSSTVFLAMVLAAALRFRRQLAQARAHAESTPEANLPSVALLKPVHGLEPKLEANLESFFQQDYPSFELVFGARTTDDPAFAVVARLRQRYPQVRVRLVASGEPQWPNAKVYSLDKMIAATDCEYLAISDSDIRVPKDFLRHVVPPVMEPKTGLLTCVYRGVPAGDLWSRLEALGMSVELASGVLVANMLEGMKFALGAVMVTRKECLQAIGGIAQTADYYSDDFVLGQRIAAAGYKVLLWEQNIGHVLLSHTFRKSFGDQLRWMKSTRYSRPSGHVGTGLTFATPFGLLALISCAALGNLRAGIALAMASVLNRIVQAVAVGWGIVHDPRALRDCWLFPLRDFLGSIVWAGSFTGRTFFWRGEKYRFERSGKIVAQRQAQMLADPLQAE
jgi:ceramide glucosyltransferase